MINMTFIMWPALFFLLIFGRVIHLKQIQAQGIGYDTEAGKAHGCRTEHRIQLQSEQRIPDSGCQRNADNVVEKCPEQVLVDVTQRCAA